MQTLARGLLNFIFPPRCGVCLAFGPEVLCAECRAAIDRLAPPWCASCGTPAAFPHADLVCRTGVVSAVRSFGRYRGILGEGIKGLKFQGRRAVGPELSALLAEFAASADGPPPTPRDLATADLIVPVPLHASRLAERGFNQAALLAVAIGAATGVPIEPVLLRTRATAFQHTVTPRERIENLRGAFAVAPGVSVKGARVLLIDDLLTTGATVAECAKVLRRAGAAAVGAITLARAGFGPDDTAVGAA